MTYNHIFTVATLALAIARAASLPPVSSAPVTSGVLLLSPDDPDVVALKAASPPKPQVVLLRESNLVTDNMAIASLAESSYSGIVDYDEPLAPLEHFNGTEADSAVLQNRANSGSDGRHLFNETTWPFRTVGKLVTESPAGGVMCTGTMVGPRHMLTAGHCVDDMESGYFMPGYDNYARLGYAYAEAVVRLDTSRDNWACVSKRDWAIVVLDRRLGDTVGYIGTMRSPRDDTFVKPGNLVTLGYSSDRDNAMRPYRMQGISALREFSLNCDVTGPLVHNAYTAPGQSGSPVWQPQAGSQDRWIVGVHSSAGTDYKWAASGSEMVQALARVKQQFP